jgi:hypothetical protein
MLETETGSEGGESVQTKRVSPPPVLTSETSFCFDSVTLRVVLRTRAAPSLNRSLAALIINLIAGEVDPNRQRKCTHSVPDVDVEFVTINAEIHRGLK